MTASISLVVPVRNAARFLPDVLPALRALSPQPAEIIFVDNASTDRTRELLREFAAAAPDTPVRIVAEPRRGASVARNTGARAARGDVIAFTDSDCSPASAWLARLVAPFDDPTVGAVAGRVVAVPARSLTELVSALFTLQLPDTPRRVREWTPWDGGYPTANLAIRRRLFEALDGFDESVEIYGEDYDLCARLYKRGSVIAYVPEARVFHHHRATVRGLLRQAFGFGRSHPYLLGRHARGLWLALPRRSFVWRGCPFTAWLDLASADKKIGAILAVSVVLPPALWLLPLYGLWLTASVRRRASAASVPCSWSAAARLAAMLVLKSGAMTAGRWYGSVRFGAACL